MMADPGYRKESSGPGIFQLIVAFHNKALKT